MSPEFPQVWVQLWVPSLSTWPPCWCSLARALSQTSLLERTKLFFHRFPSLFQAGQEPPQISVSQVDVFSYINIFKSLFHFFLKDDWKSTWQEDISKWPLSGRICRMCHYHYLMFLPLRWFYSNILLGSRSQRTTSKVLLAFPGVHGSDHHHPVRSTIIHIMSSVTLLVLFYFCRSGDCLGGVKQLRNWSKVVELGCEFRPMCLQSPDFFCSSIFSGPSNTVGGHFVLSPSHLCINQKGTNITRHNVKGIRLLACKCLPHTPKDTNTTAGSDRESIQHKLSGLLQ